MTAAAPHLLSNAAPHDATTQSPPPRFKRDWLRKLLEKYPNPTSPPDLRLKALTVAPMVDQSDLPFRLLCREFGANLAVTPMIHSRLFCTKPSYTRKFFDLQRGMPARDRPLLAQLCGSDADHVIQTARMLQPFVDGIDLNCGCPQGIAKKGQYGAFLLEQPDVLVPLVHKLARAVNVPVSVKVRILPSGVEDSLRLYQRLVEAGASMITIHGRTRFQKGPLTGNADWNAIQRAVETLPVPVLANGSMGNLDEVRECLEFTGAAGIMCSEAILEYPALLTETNTRATLYKRTGPGRLEMARRYFDLARQYPPDQGGQGSGIKCIRMHLHRFLHADLQGHTNLRTKLVEADSLEGFQEVLEALDVIHQETNHKVQDEQLSWYVRNRACNQQGENLSDLALEREALIKTSELMDDAADCINCLFDIEE